MQKSLEVNAQIDDYLKEIYEYYMEKIANEVQLIKPQGASFLGEFADEVLHSKFGVLKAGDIDRIVR